MAFGSSSNFCKATLAVPTAASFDNGAVLPSKLLAASRAALRLASAALIASANAFVAALISAVKLFGLSAAACS